MENVASKMASKISITLSKQKKINIVHSNLKGQKPSLKQNDPEDVDHNLYTKRQNEGIWSTTSLLSHISVSFKQLHWSGCTMTLHI